MSRKYGFTWQLVVVLRRRGYDFIRLEWRVGWCYPYEIYTSGSAVTVTTLHSESLDRLCRLKTRSFSWNYTCNRIFDFTGFSRFKDYRMNIPVLMQMHHNCRPRKYFCRLVDGIFNGWATFNNGFLYFSMSFVLYCIIYNLFISFNI